MSRPTCHRTLVTGSVALRETVGTPCIGSACALWVPEVRWNVVGDDNGLYAAPIALTGPRNEGDDSRATTGRGWCADNLRTPPWSDPTQPTETA